ncbi:MAG: hypothetical protein JNL42_14460 [Anaerolineae bacterium]|nr:hypothetical protein [Anaerolineae bacterium]
MNRDRRFLVAVFPSRKLLVRALDHLREDKSLHVERAAIVAKARDGEVTVVDDSLGPDEAGITGGTLGAAITLLGLVQFGALALPGIGVIIALGAGALVGGLVGSATGRFAANLIESGYHSEQIEGLRVDLESERPALVLHLGDDETALPRVREALARYRAKLVEQPAPSDARNGA